VCYGEGLRALRKFLPRPYFVHTEGALEKYLIIINSNEEVLPLVSVFAALPYADCTLFKSCQIIYAWETI
jgi:hypothetical protein